MLPFSLKHHSHLIVLLGAVIILLSVLLALLLLRLNTIEYLSPHREEVLLSPESYASNTLYLKEEEAIILSTSGTTTEQVILPVTKPLFEYVEVTDGCGIHFKGECVNVRSGPGTEYPVVAQLRNNIVLKISGIVEREDNDWYKIVFDETLRYPERVTSDWYVAADYVEVLLDEGDQDIWTEGTIGTTSKRIVIDRSEQMLRAYDADTLYMETQVSTGLALTPTPRGSFQIFKKTPSRYMQGPLPNLPRDQYYDLPGVPWNLYFTHGGAVIHGAYWHDSFGSPYSHGCVNLEPYEARKLYTWADLGTEVIVQD